MHGGIPWWFVALMWLIHNLWVLLAIPAVIAVWWWRRKG